ncbi:hypothetical protein ACOMHN_045078 [Nucella lapillus]
MTSLWPRILVTSLILMTSHRLSQSVILRPNWFPYFRENQGGGDSHPATEGSPAPSPEMLVGLHIHDLSGVLEQQQPPLPQQQSSKQQQQQEQQQQEQQQQQQQQRRLRQQREYWRLHQQQQQQRQQHRLRQIQQSMASVNCTASDNLSRSRCFFRHVSGFLTLLQGNFHRLWA